MTAPPTSSTSATQLDPNQEARYGLDDDVNAGFAGDPIEVEVFSGGPIDVSYLGGDCIGFAEPNPDVQVHYIAGAASLLRFYFIADTPGEDATLIVNDPGSQWVCNDDYDSSTHDPSVDFSPPADGYYDIWIGSYSSGDFVSGTLYITELSFNHP
ncbi:MAG TPA: peptidase S1 [Candidatus Limnocylindria bacterium]|nr:peptidase S1 [Candidatus Limnocylindria bacterium]